MKNKTKNRYRQLFILMLSTLVGTILLGCNNDDVGENAFITAEATELNFDELNTCDIGSDLMATLFVLTIPYKTSSGNEVDKIEIDMKWSNGDEDSNVEGNFTLENSKAYYDWCFRFGDTEWIEVTTRLVGKQGIKSNPSLIRIVKPEGAN